MTMTAADKQRMNQRITRVLTLFVRFFSAHWLAFANLAVGLYLGLPLMAPVLMSAGHERLAGLIYTIFRPLCHQLPERSFFLFGERLVYALDHLQHASSDLVTRRFVGDLVLGFKMAVCQRCFAIYATMLVTGLLFSLVRQNVRPLPIKGFVLMLVPIGVDGLGQLFGLWHSSWISRLITGGLFGLACVWLAYPHLERGMHEVWIDLEHTVQGWKANRGDE